ncbi:penicillin-binding protein 2 [Microbacterium sp. cx-55]|uniref:peptidoglycan D,D-transpeptidase FtsI family protein n=1 Tax=Microbacterium sp. cx-55 TaxID=2875948 RepID=UPI001CBCD7E2|nr:penicillin-binding protein 2 [Microbacterium sp. cx-55]MBZ4486648.1 penicillin-binding protein 2 [Microbacterium sp. cx-55]UGB36388.1 penicillin-binding protein 2 [Microbacterium sp. cx-55]
MTTRSTRSPRRRTVVALAVVLAVLVVFVVRLVDIQVVNAREHVDDSLAMGIGASTTLYGTRGSIVDTNGQTLAGSILQYDAELDPSNVGPITRTDATGAKVEVDWPTLAAEIGAITGQTPEDVQKIVADALAVNPDSQYAELTKGLSTEKYRALADLGIPYLYMKQHPARTYPDGAVAGNLVGFVGSGGDPLEGLESSQNQCLTSTNGERIYQRGKDGVVIPGTEQITPAVDGGTLSLTIDRDLQWYLQQLIAEQTQNQSAQHGQIMVVEAKTGKIKAAAEYPTVDPNNVSATPEADRSSRIFRGEFEPGSTFKALTAATAIDTGAATPTSTVTASGRETFPNGARVTDAISHGPTNYTLAGVLIDSSNVGISKFAEKVPVETRYDYLQRFGIGQVSGVGFPGEADGELRPVSDWDDQTFYNTSFGQGVATTLPQLMGAYQAIANDGVKVPLSLVQSCTHADGTVETPDAGASTQVVSASTAQQVREMLENVAVQGGNARAIAINGYRLGIKTGTGEISENGAYKNGVYFTTMIGMAPIDDPQYIVAVTLDQPTAVRSSAANAAAFQQAMTQVLKTYRVMPSDSQPVLLPKTG